MTVEPKTKVERVYREQGDEVADDAIPAKPFSVFVESATETI